LCGAAAELGNTLALLFSPRASQSVAAELVLLILAPSKRFHASLVIVLLELSPQLPLWLASASHGVGNANPSDLRVAALNNVALPLFHGARLKVFIVSALRRLAGH
jgi:hypothetical protein